MPVEVYRFTGVYRFTVFIGLLWDGVHMEDADHGTRHALHAG